jgi:uncharacterized repeat protein (TIGR03803 family)
MEVSPMTKVSACKIGCVVFLLSAAMASAAHAQTFTNLVSFDFTNGAYPQYMALAQGVDGNLYGTTGSGGVVACGGGNAYGCGTIFKLAPAGLTTLYSFCSQDDCTAGDGPASGLVLATDGNFYGTAGGGGNLGCEAPYGCGTVFKITSGGTLTPLNNFGLSDAYPDSVLVQATDGSLYGTTQDNTVFKITLGGTLTILHTFDGGDGQYPVGGVVQGTDGNFYGTAVEGGRGCIHGPGCGTVYKISPWGNRTTLHSFDGTDGALPYGGLVQGVDGNFYGTTATGGVGNGVGGTVFKITPGGTLTTLYNFCSQSNCTDGAGPYDTLVQATDGNFYGTTAVGGTSVSCFGQGCGTIFRITPGGTLTTLHSFDETDGADPMGGLLQSTNGEFFGTASQGGDLSCNINFDGCGTVFSLDMGLGPFVRFVRNPAKASQPFGVLGQGFTGTTSVSLNGIPASFTVKSDTLIEATVPAGGTTGYVSVTTPSRTLTSNVHLRVLPQLLSFSPPSGPVGTVVTITGVSLAQTTGVGFGDRVPASFTVNSDTQVMATVPSGAKTGSVGIQTQGGIAISSAIFTVTQ